MSFDGEYYAQLGGVYSNVELDNLVQYPVTISTVHHKVHSGKTFRACVLDTLLVSTEFVYLMDVGSKDLHVTFSVAGEAKAYIRAYEALSATTLGTTITPINMKRDASTSPYCSVYSGATINTTGTFLCSVLVPGGGERKNHIGGEVRSGTEFIFKKNTLYSVQVENGITTTKAVNIDAQWYY